MKLLHYVEELSVYMCVCACILPPGVQLSMVALPPGMGRGLSTHTGDARSH